eukprot:7600413-Ditylum_brightwellii.AAC.1
MTRATALATRPASNHKDDLPHGEEFDSFEEELVAQASHTHTLYCEDNAAVYYCLEEAVRGTQYALYLKLYQQMLYPLERFIRQHKGAFTAIKEAAEHVPFQLPNKFKRV